jgi:transposase
MQQPTGHQYELFVGVDIAAKTATIAWQRDGGQVGKPRTIEQTPEGFTRLVHALATTKVAPSNTLLVMEATGTYWVAFATFFVRLGYRVSVINALQAHHFAKALLKRAKTDGMDAQTLAQFAATLRPASWEPPPAIYEELQQRLAQRDALLQLRTQVMNQRHALEQLPVIVATVFARLQALERTLSEQIATIDQELDAVLTSDTAKDGSWTKTVTLLETIPGVGRITALWVVVSTLNLTTCSGAKQLVAYAGLAPMPRQSGTSIQKPPGIGHSGNRRLRTALYMATLTGARFNPLLAPLYERLRARGKAAKVAHCAVARKLAHLIWAIGTKQIPFDPRRAPQMA